MDDDKEFTEAIAKGRRMLDKIVDDFPPELLDEPEAERISTITVVLLLVVSPGTALSLLALAIDALAKARNLERVVGDA